jgi:hypothetical protein
MIPISRTIGLPAQGQGVGRHGHAGQLRQDGRAQHEQGEQAGQDSRPWAKLSTSSFLSRPTRRNPEPSILQTDCRHARSKNQHRNLGQKRKTPGGYIQDEAVTRTGRNRRSGPARSRRRPARHRRRPAPTRSRPGDRAGRTARRPDSRTGRTSRPAGSRRTTSGAHRSRADSGRPEPGSAGGAIGRPIAALVIALAIVVAVAPLAVRGPAGLGRGRPCPGRPWSAAARSTAVPAAVAIAAVATVVPAVAPVLVAAILIATVPVAPVLVAAIPAAVAGRPVAAFPRIAGLRRGRRLLGLLSLGRRPRAAAPVGTAAAIAPIATFPRDWRQAPRSPPP